MHAEYFSLALWIATGGAGFIVGLLGLSSAKRRMTGLASGTSIIPEDASLGVR